MAVVAAPTVAPDPAPGAAVETPVPPARPRRRTARARSSPLEEVDTPPRIATLVKPTYPPLALKARIGGIVVLRVLVSEKGCPLRVEVVREGRAGLDEAAVAAVRRWTLHARPQGRRAGRRPG